MERREVEAKVILDSCSELEDVAKLLESMGGVCESEDVEEDLYFQHPCRDFAETDEALRLRRGRGGFRITYKGPKEGGDIKSRLEVEVEVGDYDAMKALLERLGFKPVLVVRKRRRYCKLGEATITLDNVEGLGCFVEVEAPDETLVRKLLEELRLAGKPRTTLSYLEMLIQRLKTGKAKA